MEKPSDEEIFSFLLELHEFEELKFTVTNSAKCAAITAASAGAGGILGGSRGLFLGGAIGGICSFFLSPNFKSLPTVLEEMTEKDRKKLGTKIRNLLLSYGISKLSAYAIANNVDNNIVKLIEGVVINFVESECGYQRVVS